jgi:hypothetical protein
MLAKLSGKAISKAFGKRWSLMAFSCPTTRCRNNAMEHATGGRSLPMLFKRN